MARLIVQNHTFSLENKVVKSIIDRLQSEGCIFAEEETQLLVSEAGSIEELMKMAEMDGLVLQRKVVEEASLWLAPGGHLLVETSEMQGAQTFEIFANAGLMTKIARVEELDATIVIETNSGK